MHPEIEGYFVPRLICLLRAVSFRRRHHRQWLILNLISLLAYTQVLVLIFSDVFVLARVPFAIPFMTLPGIMHFLDFISRKVHHPFHAIKWFGDSSIWQLMKWLGTLIDDASDNVKQSVKIRGSRWRVALHAPTFYTSTQRMTGAPMAPQSASSLNYLRQFHNGVYTQCIIPESPQTRIEIIVKVGTGHYAAILQGLPFAFRKTQPNLCWRCSNRPKQGFTSCNSLRSSTLANKDHGRGRLALIKTCKLVYQEMIRLLCNRIQD